MPRLVRANPDRDENAPASLDDCLAHRCQKHATVPPCDASADDGAECGLCIGDLIANKYAAAFESQIFWPLIQSARDRLNLLARGAGDSFEAEARERITNPPEPEDNNKEEKTNG